MTVEGWEHLRVLPEGVRVAEKRDIRCVSCCDILTDGDEIKLYCPFHKFDTKAEYTCPYHIFYRREEE